MPGLAADIAYLVGAVASDMLLTLLGLIVLFVVVLAVRDGLARGST
ncbi:hypothetical protein [Oscillochloris sp. ZM17-4]|nr:hypothetical protein [Oscillochloris sp. ZM17-4]